MIDGRMESADYFTNLANDSDALARAGLTSDEALMLARQIERGVATPALFNTLIASARGRMTNVAAQKLIDGWMTPFARTESASRRIALLAAYRLQYDRSIRSGQSAEDASRIAE
ncbi:hypothetical protein V6O07_13640, partial [Arthrospira platensis SPKY2]